MFMIYNKVESHFIADKACSGHNDCHSLTNRRERNVYIFPEDEDFKSCHCNFFNHSESMEVGHVAHSYVTLPALESGVRGLFRGLYWLNVLLVLFFTGLLVGELSLSALQGWD